MSAELQTVTTTNIVPSFEGYCMQQAARLVPGTLVEVISPENDAEVDRAVWEHVDTLVIYNGVQPDEEADFRALAASNVRWELTDPDRASVLVRMTTATGEVGIQQANILGRYVYELLSRRN